MSLLLKGIQIVQFSMVVADGGGLVPLTYLITSVPAGSSLKTTTLSTLHAVPGIISGPSVIGGQWNCDNLQCVLAVLV